MKCPLLWKTTIDPVSLHLIPSISAQLWLFILGFILLALIIGLILWLFSVRFPSRSERGPFRIYRWWTDHAANSIWTAGVRDDKEGQGVQTMIFWGKDFEDPYFCWDVPGPYLGLAMDVSCQHMACLRARKKLNDAGLLYSKGWDKGGPIPKAWRSGDGDR